METYRNEMTERIFNLTLEIIYLLTGEDYIVVKKSGERLTPNSCHHVCGGLSRTQSPITVPPPHSLVREEDSDQKILELTNKIIQLLTGEEEKYIEGHMDLYKDKMMENHQPLTSLDVSEDEVVSHTKFPSLDCGHTDIHVIGNYQQSQCFNIYNIQNGLKSVTNETKEYISRDGENITHTDMYTPTDHTQYTSTHIKEESVSCDGGNLTDTDIYTPTYHTQYTPTHSKEESVSSDGGDLTYSDSYTPLDHTITLGYADGDIKQNSLLVKENKKLDEPVEMIHQTSPIIGNINNISSNPEYIVSTLHSAQHQVIERKIDNVFLKPCFDAAHPGHTSGDIVQRQNVELEQKKTFGDISNLTKYWRENSRKKTPQCSQCGKYFLRNTLLARHQKTHTGPKPFQCSVCGKCFWIYSRLVVHQRYHTGEKPYQCSQSGSLGSENIWVLRW